MERLAVTGSLMVMFQGSSKGSHFCCASSFFNSSRYFKALLKDVRILTVALGNKTVAH